jgi:Gpi18-like mannosyltransferase
MFRFYLARRLLGTYVDRRKGAANTMSNMPRRTNLIIGGVLLLGVVLRIAFLNVISPDAHYYLLSWFQQLSANGLGALRNGGPSNVLGTTNANYSPPYYYLLWIATHLSPIAPPLWLIKSISFCFDGLGAFFAYKIARLHLSKQRALLTGALLFGAPTAIVNSGWLGQCDMIWTSLVLGSVYFALRRRSWLSIAFFALAFSFKAQACFILPFLFMLAVQGEITFSAAAAIPLVYSVMLLPAIAAGVNWELAATTYARQADAYHRLSSNAPNLYYLFATRFYAPGVAIGLVTAALGCFALAVLPRLRKTKLEITGKVLAATMFLAVTPFLLPKMHDRYFFAADMSAIILAAYVPRLWIVPVILQISSLCAIAPDLAWTFVHRVPSPSLPVAVMLCTVVVGYLVFAYWSVCINSGSFSAKKVRALAIAAIAILVANCVWEIAAAAQHIVASHACKGSSTSPFCMFSLPGDWIANGTWAEWVVFALIQLLCLAATVHFVKKIGGDRSQAPIMASA